MANVWSNEGAIAWHEGGILEKCLEHTEHTDQQHGSELCCRSPLRSFCWPFDTVWYDFLPWLWLYIGIYCNCCPQVPSSSKLLTFQCHLSGLQALVRYSFFKKNTFSAKYSFFFLPWPKLMNSNNDRTDLLLNKSESYFLQDQKLSTLSKLIPTCSVNRVSHSDQPTENYQPPSIFQLIVLVLWPTTLHFGSISLLQSTLFSPPAGSYFSENLW